MEEGAGGGVIELKKVKIAAGKHNIAVGKGGDGAPAGGKNGQADIHEFTINGKQGANSSFGSHIAIGGGYGGSSYQDHILRGKGGDGGSGGGGSGYCWHKNQDKAGKGTKTQGFDGGYGAGAWYGAGGGGADQPGGGPSTDAGGAYGGNGKLSDIIGVPYYWAGGGGGSSYSTTGGNGGLGGGGGGAVGSTTGGAGYFNGSPGGGGCTGCWSQTRGGDGAPHTGGGGGGGSHYNRTNDGGNGGSGIVIVRFKKFAKMHIDNNSKILTLHNNPFKNDENTTTSIFTNSGAITLNPNTHVDVLIVGGGGGGARNDGAEGGGGGGGGGVIHAKLKIPQSSRSLFVVVGHGGGQNTQGDSSSITYNNNSGNQIILSAIGGGTGGGSYDGCSDGRGGIGKPGGSGGGGSGFCHDLDGGSSIGIKNKDQIPNTDSSIVSYNYYGNKGGLGHNQAGGAGGGGAKEPGNSTTHRFQDYWPVRQNTSGRGGGSGINIALFNTNYYGAGGAGSISHHGRKEQEWHGGNHVRGGYGGGGNAYLRHWNATNGLVNTGSGGGGSSIGLAGSGGSGIVIVRYTNNNTKVFRLRFPVITYVTIDDGDTAVSQFLHGTYRVSITPSETTISIDTLFPITGVTTLSLEKTKFITNKIDFIYNLFKSIEDINRSVVSKPANNLISAYLNNMAVNGGAGIPFISKKYNSYYIKTYITKTYKTITNSVDFNVAIYTPEGDLIPSNYYSIRYEFPETSSANVIIPINIYLSIKPIDNISGTKFIVKTYIKSSQGLNGEEIHAFMSNEDKVTKFNNIVNWNISLTEKNVWGIEEKSTQITILEQSRITLANINNISNNLNSYESNHASHIRDINSIINIKDIINKTAVSSGVPTIKPGISISSPDLFPLSTNENPILNYSITDYISYESPTQKAPDNRVTQFNILDSATKYVYFSLQ